MKTIIAGPRDFFPSDNQISVILNQVYEYGITTEELVCGMAKGVDTRAYEYFQLYFPDKKIHEFPANWKKYGKCAGPRRNLNMAENADALIAIGVPEIVVKGSGTQHMVKAMIDLQKPVVAFSREIKLIMAFEPAPRLL